MEKAGRWKKLVNGRKWEKVENGNSRKWKRKKLEKEKAGKRKKLEKKKVGKRKNKCLTMYPENDRIPTTGKTRPAVNVEKRTEE